MHQSLLEIVLSCKSPQCLYCTVLLTTPGRKLSETQTCLSDFSDWLLPRKEGQQQLGGDLQAPVLLLGHPLPLAPPSWSSRPAVFPFSGLVSLPGACLCCRCLLLLENEDSATNVQTTWKEKALSLQVLGSRSSHPLRAVGDVTHHHGSPGALSLS